MIITVTPNPTIDQIYWVDRVQDPGAALLTRARQTRSLPGGKGINVSVLLGRLGVESIAMGIIAGSTGKTIERLLHAEKVTTNFVWTNHESRTNVAIIEAGKEIHPFEVNAPGPAVSDSARERFMRRYRNALKRSSCVMLGGSLPPGLPEDFYRELIRLAHEAEVKTVFNASGTAFAAAYELGPWISKPDIRERAEVLGKPVKTVEDALAAGRKLLETGSEIAVIGHDLTQPVAHQLVVTREGAWDYRTTEVKVDNRVGAGDAFIGGFMFKLQRGKPVREAGRFGMAAAVASAESDQTVVISRRDIEEAAERVEEVAL